MYIKVQNKTLKIRNGKKILKFLKTNPSQNNFKKLSLKIFYKIKIYSLFLFLKKKNIRNNK